MNMFLPNATDPVVWRGPMVSSAIKQFYSDVDWGQLDFLLVDLPPGTSDAPMTVMQSLPLDGVIVVSSPQMLATEIVMKCIKMVQTLKGKILGVVENMAYMTMPDGERRRSSARAPARSWSRSPARRCWRRSRSIPTSRCSATRASWRNTTARPSTRWPKTS